MFLCVCGSGWQNKTHKENPYAFVCVCVCLTVMLICLSVCCQLHFLHPFINISEEKYFNSNRTNNRATKQTKHRPQNLLVAAFHLSAPLLRLCFVSTCIKVSVGGRTWQKMRKSNSTSICQSIWITVVCWHRSGNLNKKKTMCVCSLVFGDKIRELGEQCSTPSVHLSNGQWGSVDWGQELHRRFEINSVFVSALALTLT